jgi:citrate lyase beta subunit
MESDETASTLKALLKAAEESAHIHSPQKLQQHSTPAVNSPLNARVRNLEEQLESERGIHEGIVSALLETASGILNGTGVAEPSNGVHLVSCTSLTHLYLPRWMGKYHICTLFSVLIE